MTAAEVKQAISWAVAKVWPGTQKMSELPFPEYWRAQCEWLEFHAPRVGGEYARGLVRGMVAEAALAEREGREPVAWEVPEDVRAMWAGKDGGRGEGSPRAGEDGRAARDNAAERAAAVRDRFAERRRARQGELL